MSSKKATYHAMGFFQSGSSFLQGMLYVTMLVTGGYLISVHQMDALTLATFALDQENEAIVQESLEDLCRNRTCLTIAHRLSTIKNAQEIIVLDDGIKERGTHEELMRQNGLYARYYNLSLRQ